MSVMAKAMPPVTPSQEPVFEGNTQQTFFIAAQDVRLDLGDYLGEGYEAGDG